MENTDDSKKTPSPLVLSDSEETTYEYSRSSQYSRYFVMVIKSDSEEAKQVCETLDAEHNLAKGSTKKYRLYNNGKDRQGSSFGVVPLKSDGRELASETTMSDDDSQVFARQWDSGTQTLGSDIARW